MYSFARGFLNTLDDVDGFILKSRSPTCGIKDAKIFNDSENPNPVGRGPGLFAEKVLEVFPGAAIEDEGRLMNFNIRESFLTKLFIFARFREVKTNSSQQEIVDFHTDNKLIFMTYNQNEMRTLEGLSAIRTNSKSKMLFQNMRLTCTLLCPRTHGARLILIHSCTQLGTFQKN